jgi:hypothetical protein
MRRRLAWSVIHDELARHPAKSVVCVRRGLIEHPAIAGAVRSSGLNVGQLAHWRFPPDAHGGGVHVHEYAHEWRAHLDRVHPRTNLLAHFLVDVL